MKKLMLTTAVVGVMASMQAQAALITFDDLPGDKSAIPNGYAGLNWSNFDNLDATTYDRNPSGYLAGLISPKNVAYNDLGHQAILSNNAFDLVSAYLTAAWNDNLQLTVTGSLLGVQKYQHTYTLSATTPTLINFNFNGVDSVVFDSSGGTLHSTYDPKDGFGHPEFVMDNLTVDSITAVPEPSTYLAGFSAIGMFLFAFRNRK